MTAPSLNLRHAIIVRLGEKKILDGILTKTAAALAMENNYLIISGEWTDSLHCLTRAGDPSKVPLGLVSLERDLAFRC